MLVACHHLRRLFVPFRRRRRSQKSLGSCSVAGRRRSKLPTTEFSPSASSPTGSRLSRGGQLCARATRRRNSTTPVAFKRSTCRRAMARQSSRPGLIQPFLGASGNSQALCRSAQARSSARSSGVWVRISRSIIPYRSIGTKAAQSARAGSRLGSSVRMWGRQAPPIRLTARSADRGISSR